MQARIISATTIAKMCNISCLILNSGKEFDVSKLGCFYEITREKTLEK